jgi:methylated-DNA-[protein]-cysteine S-methyltransferase
VTAFATWRSPLGAIAVEATDRGVCGILVRASRRARPAVSAAARRNLEMGLAALRDYFDGRAPALPELDLRGSDFDLRVWRALLAIGWGETASYGALASRLGQPLAARAVGSACGRNPVPILVPCHRVVGVRGGLGGYSGGGAEVKRWLLAHEAGHSPALRPG